MESGAIADSKITASSIEGGHEAWKGRLNGNSSWMPSRKTDTEFIKVTFTATKTVVAIATQGAPDASCWVKSYGLQLYSGTTGKSGTLISKVKKNSKIRKIVFKGLLMKATATFANNKNNFQTIDLVTPIIIRGIFAPLITSVHHNLIRVS